MPKSKLHTTYVTTNHKITVICNYFIHLNVIYGTTVGILVEESQCLKQYPPSICVKKGYHTGSQNFRVSVPVSPQTDMERDNLSLSILIFKMSESNVDIEKHRTD